jgi:hypothetical protein
MYLRDARMRAIELYIKYGKRAADVRCKLGCPDRKSLRSKTLYNSKKSCLARGLP